ncbi:MAG: hypothetical protein ACFFC7_06790 [Candidatus Hermodarchaeota archaeon]
MKQNYLIFLIFSLLFGILIFASFNTVLGISFSEMNEIETTKDNSLLVNPIVGVTDEGDDDSDDGESEDEDQSHDRELQFNIEDYQVEIESMLKTGEQKDKIEFDIRVEDEARIELEYTTSVNLTTESELGFRVKFDKIFEYIDNEPGDIGYQKGEEVSEYDIGEATWMPIEFANTIVNGTTVYIISTMTTDNVFGLVFRISEKILALENSTLVPNSLKLDIIINNYPNVSDSSNLALRAKIETESEIYTENETFHEEYGYAENETSIAIDSSAINNTGFFSWSDNAIADNQTITVISSDPIIDPSDDDEDDETLEPGELSYTLFFSFITTPAQNILWDPTFSAITADFSEQNDTGTSSTPTTPTTSIVSTPGFTLDVAVLSVAIGAILILSHAFIRRKRK